jgi:hypothetical protein
MKTHTTNYTNTFIEVAEDCPATSGAKSVANLQFDMVSKHPYKYTSDEVLFQVFAERNDLSESQLNDARIEFFSKGQPCFRASPLTKRYGFGVHNNAEGKIALFGVETKEYQQFTNNTVVQKVKAIRSKKA